MGSLGRMAVVAAVDKFHFRQFTEGMALNTNFELTRVSWTHHNSHGTLGENPQFTRIGKFNFCDFQIGKN